jgi:Tol biopolymer transport system component
MDLFALWFLLYAGIGFTEVEVARALRIGLVLLLASSVLVVVPGEVEATVPGGIGRIVFDSDADHFKGEIYVREFGGSDPIRITTNTDAEYSPKWSPDGTRIAFGRWGVGVMDLYVMDPDGSNEVKLTNGEGTINQPADWSPDGTRILFSSARSGNRDLWVMNTDGTHLQQLTNTVADEDSGAWSPDGTTIAFYRYMNFSDEIWLMDADGSNQRNLINRLGRNLSPAWSPDGTMIAFTSDFSGGLWDIWVMGSDGSNPANLTNSPLTYDKYPAWSPDGSKIAFSSDRDGDSDIWTMNPDGTAQAHLTDNLANETSVDWESVNRLPVAVDDEATTRPGVSVEITPLANDSDPDGEPLSITGITRTPEHGSVVINASGTVTYTHDGWLPPPGNVNTYIDGFEYQIQDFRLGSAWADVVVRIVPGFDDVPDSSVFHDDISWLAEQQITRGCNPPDNTLFCPTDPVTRGQMAAFLVRALGYTDDGGGDLFIDDGGSVFENDINRLGTAGVTKGCNPPVNDMYCPDDPVTRGQMAAFLVRALDYTDNGGGNLFVDDDGSIFEDQIDKLATAGVTRGCNPPVNDQFCPNSVVTRGQMAAFLHRARG